MWNDPRLKFPTSCPIKHYVNKTEDEDGSMKLEEYPIPSKLIQELLWNPVLDLEKVIQMQTRHTFR